MEYRGSTNNNKAPSEMEYRGSTNNNNSNSNTAVTYCHGVQRCRSA